jgi:1-acyl-sn-glycerol-3-phosphate acyltransferase
LLLRTLLVWSVGLFLTVLFFIPVPLAALIDRSGNSVHLIGRIWSRLLIFLSGVRVEITGLNNLLSDKPYLLIANHQEALDIPVLQAMLPVQFRWISKERVFRFPIIGWTMSLAGYVRMDRTSSRASYAALVEATEKLKNGTSILIFPEGTRSKGNHINTFKRGPFLLAIRAETPIIPISINGTKNIIKSGWPWIHPEKVKVHIDSPIKTEGLEEKDALILKNKIQDIVCKNFKKLELP